jgi:inhibitor of cysteine peptidase
MESHEKVAAGLILAAMMATAGLITFAWANPEPVTPDRGGGLLSTFSNRHQIVDFLKSSEKTGSAYYDSAPRATMGMNEQLASSPSYSRTNVQVAGVDEMDTVKTDGKYIYISSWDEVNILNAYPPTSLENVSKINESLILGHDENDVYISFNGVFVLPQKLIVVASWYENHYVLYDDVARVEVPTDYYGPRAYVFIFDMNDPSQPKLDYSVGISGYVQTARMIGDRVYLIAQHYQWMTQSEMVLPRVWIGADSRELGLDSIYYDPEMRDASSFLSVLALNVSSEKYESVSVVAGYASTIYMSEQAIFMTIQKWVGEISVVNGENVVEDSNTITTTIFKIAFDGLSMKAVARGDVKGWLLNQFSMDEKEPFLRVATTNMFFQPADGTTMSNSVFVLDSDLNVVGSLTDIAPTERIYSARFIDDTLYLVTFRRIDPLFAIDLKDPTNPKIVGELEMPGFSSYLHPVDATHVLGIGSENSMVKVSLYNVTDPTKPVEQSKFILDGYSYSWSNVEYDHKAVLFDLEKQLLVIPISAYRQYGDYYSDSGYITGALVLKVSIDDGISLRGIVEHKGVTQYSSEYVFRSLYIGDFLYTVSNTMVKVSALSDLSEIGSLIYYTYDYRYYYAL